MQWYVIADDYMNYLRAVDSYVPYTGYGTGKVKLFFGEILKTEHFSYYPPIGSGDGDVSDIFLCACATREGMNAKRIQLNGVSSTPCT